MLELNSENFEKEVLKSEKPVLVDFWAPWCGPCQVLGPVIEQLANEVEPVKVAKLNVDDNQDLAREYQVQGIPTVLLFVNGEVKERIVGVRGKEDYLEVIEKNK